ncbi:MAG: DUF4157 domain-containing protein [Cyanobacteria bacterium]|nr:DUF4157 domain-containing protein [Cyanobacteriota bacterium]MDA0866662.1 DUF4157 domain-containing protein [Cyanobacteriota bacterium]
MAAEPAVTKPVVGPTILQRLAEKPAPQGQEERQEQNLGPEFDWQRQQIEAPLSVMRSAQVGAAGGDVGGDLEQRIQRSRGQGQEIAAPMRGKLEEAFGRDFGGVRIHANTEADQLNRAVQAKAFTTGNDIYFKQGEYRPESRGGQELLAHELTHVVQQTTESFEIQRSPEQKKENYIKVNIHVDTSMTQEEYKLFVIQKYNLKISPEADGWNLKKDSYGPENSPYPLLIDVGFLSEGRNQASGISVEEDGSISGAEKRARTFHAGSTSDEKSALMQEIDRRYFETVGDVNRTRIKLGEKGKAELWLAIRDEVLFQHEYIANLPPKIKRLIKFSTKGKELTPTDYDKLFDIAKKIQGMPTEQIRDYESKVTGATTDLGEFEASLDKYIAEIAERQQQSEKRENAQVQLIGLEDIYRNYKTSKSLEYAALMSINPDGGAVLLREAGRRRTDLEIQLQAHGFVSVTGVENRSCCGKE